MINNVLTQEELDQNRETIISLLRTVNREGAHIEELIQRLMDSDFFIAPASTKYHGAYPGGLADHTLCVYNNLVSLIKSKHLEEKIPMESVIITSLLHDLDKINSYEVYQKNIPPREGKPKWTQEDFYKNKEDSEKFIYGNHEQNSEYLARQFIPLKKEESIAILHHMGGMHFDCAQDNIGRVYTSSPLSVLLHVADMLAAYIEKA